MFGVNKLAGSPENGTKDRYSSGIYLNVLTKFKYGEVETEDIVIKLAEAKAYSVE